MNTADPIRDLACAVRRLSPDVRAPEAFHRDKDISVTALVRLARQRKKAA